MALAISVDNAAPARAASTPVSPAVVEELTDEFNLVEDNGDGTFTLTTALLPQRARVGHDWRGIDLDLALNGGRYQPAVSAQPVSFSAGGDTELVTMTVADGTLSLHWPEVLPIPRVDGASVVYESVMAGVDLSLTATPVGYTQVLIVHDAEAAENPALQSLEFGFRAEGLTVNINADGSSAVKAKDDTTVMTGSPPIMWDSTIAPAAGPAPTAESVGTGDVAPLEVDLSSPSTVPGEPDIVAQDLVISPPLTALTGPDVNYPLYIDPSVGRGRLNWAEVFNNGWHYFNDPSWNPKVGKCAFANCNNIGTGRAYMQFDLSALKGVGTPAVIGSKLYLEQIWGAHGCTAEPVSLYKSGPFASSTTWPGPLDTGPTGYLSTTSSGVGTQCGDPGQIAFQGTNLDGYIRDAMIAGRSDINFAIRAADEDEPWQWKQFSNAPQVEQNLANVLQVRYSYPPQRPTGLNVSHAVTCNGDGIRYTSDQRPTFSAIGNDGNTGHLQNQYFKFELRKGNGHNDVVPSGTRMNAGDRFETDTGDIYLAMQTDGNLVLYSRGTPLWSSRTAGNNGGYAVMQGDGNLVVRSSTGAPLWYTSTAGNNGSWLGVQIDGNLVLRHPNNTPLWTSGTSMAPGVLKPLWTENTTTIARGSGETALWAQTRDDLGTSSWLLSVNASNAPGTNLYQTSSDAYMWFDSLQAPTTTPVISSHDYPREGWGPHNGTFHLDAGNEPNVVAFAYSWIGPGTEPAVTDCNYDQTGPNGGIIEAVDGVADLPVPSNLPAGPHRLVVKSIDKAHSPSPESEEFHFYSAPNFGLTENTSRDLTIGPAWTGPVAEVECTICDGNAAVRLGSAASGIGSQFTYSFSVSTEADYSVGAWLRKGPNRGQLTFAITGPGDGGPTRTIGRTAPDGTFAATRWEGYNETTSQTLDYLALNGHHLVANSTYKIRFTIAGKHDDSTSFVSLLDRLSFVPIARVSSTFSGAFNNKGFATDPTISANFASNDDQDSLSRTSTANVAGTPGTTTLAVGRVININGATFSLPAPNADGNDNVVMAGQTLTMPANTAARTVDFLVASTCGDTPKASTAAVEFIYADGTGPDRNIPPVPNFLTTSALAPIDQYGTSIVQAVTTAYSTRGATAVPGRAARLYAVHFDLGVPSTVPAPTLAKIVLPTYGSDFTCGSPALHLLAYSTST